MRSLADRAAYNTIAAVAPYFLSAWLARTYLLLGLNLCTRRRRSVVDVQTRWSNVVKSEDCQGDIFK